MTPPAAPPAAAPTLAPSAAVARLAAAGDDIQALASAIAAASFLDDTPGDNRQKLRAARTRLRKALAAAQQGGGTSATSTAAAAAPSPHARASYPDADRLFPPLAAAFEEDDGRRLKWRLLQKPGGATVKPDDFYRLGALRRQALEGDVAGERPMWADKGGLDFDGRARWDAWAELRGLGAAEARARFVALLHEFPPSALYSDTRGKLLMEAAKAAAAAAAGEGDDAAAGKEEEEEEEEKDEATAAAEAAEAPPTPAVIEIEASATAAASG